MGIIKGLAKTALYGGLLLGAFLIGRSLAGVDADRIYIYLDNNPKYIKEVFTYTRNKLEKSDPSFLNSLIDINNLTDEQKRKVTKNYLEQKVGEGYDQVKKSLENLSKDISNILSK